MNKKRFNCIYYSPYKTISQDLESGSAASYNDLIDHAKASNIRTVHFTKKFTQEGIFISVGMAEEYFIPIKYLKEEETERELFNKFVSETNFLEILYKRWDITINIIFSGAVKKFLDELAPYCKLNTTCLIELINVLSEENRLKLEMISALDI